METILIYRKRCPHCNSVVEWSREDICRHEAPPEKIDEGYRICFRTYIYCKSCKKEIILAENEIVYRTAEEIVDCDFLPINH